MGSLFHTAFFQPILNLLVWLYDIIPGNDLGLAIIAMTVVIKIVLLPLSRESIKSQKAMQDLQPKIEEIKKQYADNKEELGRATLALYKENKVNPLSSCLPVLIQFPFLIAVFQVLRSGLENGVLDQVYSFVARPESIDYISFGLIDLQKTSYVMAVAAGLAQFWQTKMLSAKKPETKDPAARDESVMALMNKQMQYMMPAITVVIGFSMPGGLTLYWLTTTLLTVAQQYLLFTPKKKIEANV